MIRRLYLATLALLQFALLSHLAPPLAQSLRVGGALALLPAEGHAAALLLATTLAALGVSIALAFPVIALSRHLQRGAARFAGIPRGPVVLAFAGATAFVMASLANLAVARLAADAFPELPAVAGAASAAGAALMAAGVLAAELLRRSVAPPHSVRSAPTRPDGLLEVTFPPELCTRAA